MTARSTLIALAAFALALGSAQARVALEFDSPNGGFLDSSSRMLGWQFTVSVPLALHGLAWYDQGQDGLAVAHEVGLWDAADASLVAQATVPAGAAAALDGHFRTVALPSVVTLQPGTVYRLQGFDPGNGDAHVWDADIGAFGAQVNGFRVDPAITLGAPGTAVGPYAAAFGVVTATIGDARRAQMGPNLLLSPVPEPGTWALFAAGLLAVGRLARRQSRSRPATIPGWPID